ncbi:MAG: hypothetical protein M2R45_04314 [Verrucomicrobia subdivision 3 bacterium]|nr:hypothetical protein [Limisphaerales bacterium]MCS1417229.1 hypothetical protein [Limisphaerales bacterium]
MERNKARFLGLLLTMFFAGSINGNAHYGWKHTLEYHLIQCPDPGCRKGWSGNYVGDQGSFSVDLSYYYEVIWCPFYDEVWGRDEHHSHGFCQPQGNWPDFVSAYNDHHLAYKTAVTMASSAYVKALIAAADSLADCFAVYGLRYFLPSYNPNCPALCLTMYNNAINAADNQYQKDIKEAILTINEAIDWDIWYYGGCD